MAEGEEEEEGENDKKTSRLDAMTDLLLHPYDIGIKGDREKVIVLVAFIGTFFWLLTFYAHPTMP